MKLIKALVALIVALVAVPVTLYKRYKEDQLEEQLEEQLKIDLLVHTSLVQFYEFLLTREELSDMDIAYLLREHKQRVRPCIAEIVRNHKGEPLSTNAVLTQAMRQAISY